MIDITKKHELDPKTHRCIHCGMDKEEMLRITTDVLETPLEKLTIKRWYGEYR